MRIEGRKVLVIGLGLSGRAAVRLLLQRGAEVRVLDSDESAARGATARELKALGAQLDCGPHSAGQLGDAELLVLSPGVPPTIPPVAAARAAGIPVLGELELGARLARGRLLGITGSNGKSTATTLATEMLDASGLRVTSGGNLGRPLCDILLTEDSDDSLHCLEISSFQCETLEEARLAVVAILNVSPDHLDRYADLEAYAEAKLSLLDRQDEHGAAVLAADDACVAAAAARARGRVAWFGAGELPGPGVGVSEGRLVSTLPGHEGELARTDSLWSAAPHDALNAAAASALALLTGGTAAGVSRALQAFSGLPHRCAIVETPGTVRFVNDSKATNVAAAAAAIEGSAPGTVAILGGRHKGGDLAPLREALIEVCGSAVLIGEASDEIAGVLGASVSHERCASLEQAVERAAELAGQKGTVLLAPACASFDMFSSFEERGEVFAAAARDWAGKGAG
jgi:UDP-N-acetylmuramoylalanine--D-glutamate ligase